MSYPILFKTASARNVAAIAGIAIAGISIVGTDTDSESVYTAPSDLNLETLGNGTLSDAISCKVEEERNGSYELEMTYPIDGIHFKEIGLNDLLLVKPNYTDDPQLFRIYRTTKPLNGICTIYAQHITYDLSGVILAAGISTSGLTATLAMMTDAVEDLGFEITATRTASGTFETDVPASVRSWFGGKKGSLIDVFGGEWHYDNFTCTLNTARGTNRGVTIRYGKNLTELTQNAEATNLYTGIQCYYKPSQGNIITGNIVATGISLDTPKYLVVDASSQFSNETPTIAQLDAYAQTYIDANNLTIPLENIVLDFVQLQGLSERVDLCDTVTIQYPKLGINATAKCVKCVWDVLQDRYTKSVFGMAKSTLADGIATISQEEANKSAAYMSRNILNTVSELAEDLEAQIDAKIETWVQNTAPSTAWTTTALQTEHNGDLWYYTGLRYITVNGVTIQPTKTYQYNGSTNKWAAYNNPTTSIFDFADGKTTVYYGSPTGTYTNVEVGDYLVDSSDGSTYRRVGISWTKVTDYASAIANAKSELETTIDTSTALITGNSGGYVVIHDSNNDGKPDEILIMDTDSISTATKVWRWNKNGLGYSSTGYSGTYGLAMTANGQIVADFITTGNLNASLITTGVLNASLITTGSLSADRISGGEITSSAINVVSDSASKSWVTVSFTLGANTYSVKVTPTGFRVELNGVLRAYLSNDSLSLYDSNGNPTFDVASDTGDVILGGDLTATNVYAENENGTNTQLQPIMKWTASAVSFNGYGCYNTGIAANTYTVLSARTPVGSSFAGAVLTPFVAYGTWWLRATDWNSGAIITGGSWTVTAYYIKQV